MENQKLDVNKNNILNLEKKQPDMYNILLANKDRRMEEYKRNVESYYESFIERRILNRNNVGLTFLTIDEDSLLTENVKINLLKELLENKGFTCSIFKEYNAKYLSIEWDLNSYLEDGKENSSVFTKLHRDFGLFDIPIVKHIEDYAYKNILPMIVDEDAKENTHINVNLPEWLEPFPCQKILSEIFLRNRISFLTKPENLNIVKLSWDCDLAKSDIISEFSLKEYNKCQETIHLSLDKSNEKLECLNERYSSSSFYLRTHLQVYESEREMIIEEMSAIELLGKSIRDFYFQDIDLDNLRIVPSFEAKEETKPSLDSENINEKFKSNFKKNDKEKIESKKMSDCIKAILTKLEIEKPDEFLTKLSAWTDLFLIIGAIITISINSPVLYLIGITYVLKAIFRK